jgi:N,N'-diacetyllegionaminate synthase
MAFQFSKNFQISDRLIGSGAAVFIIAEAGLAHFGSLSKAYELIDMAVAAKADAIKFQVYRTNELISSACPDWIERFKPKELPFRAFEQIAAFCRKKGIIFFATAHDDSSLEFLNTLDVPVFKIGSGEVSNWTFVEKIASYGKPVILSTGMYRLEQIGQALKIFQKVNNPNIVVLHCITQYPTPASEVNLRAIETIRATFEVVTGYSDHTAGFHFPLAAAALGAQVIEKHITLDFDVPNAQDWKVSCGPDNLHLMVQQIREIEQGLGSGVKMPGKAEQNNLQWARKSLVTTRDITAGEILTAAEVGFKRPGTGIAPNRLNDVIGKKAKINLSKDQLLEWEHLF